MNTINLLSKPRSRKWAMFLEFSRAPACYFPLFLGSSIFWSFVLIIPLVFFIILPIAWVSLFFNFIKMVLFLQLNFFFFFKIHQFG